MVFVRKVKIEVTLYILKIPPGAFPILVKTFFAYRYFRVRLPHIIFKIKITALKEMTKVCVQNVGFQL